MARLPEDHPAYYIDVAICLVAMVLAVSTVWTRPWFYVLGLDMAIPSALVIGGLMLAAMGLNHALADYAGQ